MSNNPDGNPTDDQGKPKKGPKLFRPGETPKEEDKSKAEAPVKPKLFRPGETLSPAAPPAAPTPEPSVLKPKLFRPTEAEPPKTVIPSAEPSAKPKLFRPTESSPTPSPAVPPMAPSLSPVEPPKSKPRIMIPSVPSPQASAPKPIAEPESPKPKIIIPKEIPPQPTIPKMEEKIPEPIPKIEAIPEPEPEAISEPVIQKAPAIKVEPSKSAPKVSSKEEKKKVEKSALLSMATKTDEPKIEPKQEAKRGKKEEPEIKKGEKAKEGKKETTLDKTGKLIREQLYEEVDVRLMWYRAILAGFLATLSMIIISYLIYCFTDDSILTRTYIFTIYSNGNVMNEVIGIWTVTYTPITAFNSLVEDWLDNWYLHFAPTIFASVFIGGMVKNVKYSLLGVFFFFFFSMILPFIFLVFLPVFNVMDPSSVDGGLISAYPTVIANFTTVSTYFSGLTHCIFLGWTVQGSIELALLATPFTMIFAIIFSIVSKIFSKD